MGQAPGSAEEINNFCSLNYQTTFPRFAKIKVNGKEADPLYVCFWREAFKNLPISTYEKLSEIPFDSFS